MSAIAAAFARAGISAPEERLLKIAASIVRTNKASWSEPDPSLTGPVDNKGLIQLAREAIKATDTWDGAKEELYARVRRDPDLLWAMFAPYRAQAAQMVLTQASRELRQLEAIARPQPSAGTSNQVNTTVMMPPRSAPRPSAAIPTIDQQRAAMGAWAAVVQLSMLDTFKVNGQPIGDLTSAEAVKWAGARERDARFVRLLTANLPADEPIRKFRTGEDAAALYAQAEAANV